MAIEIDILKSINYFAGLSISELESISKYMIEKAVNKGEIILFEGEWSDYLYFLIAGLVKVYKSSSNGKEQILHIAPPGESLNDVSTFDGGTNQASMLAMTPVHLYAIRKEDLMTYLTSNIREYISIFLRL